MKTAILCLGLLALVGSSVASLDALNSVKESQELEHTGGHLEASLLPSDEAEGCNLSCSVIQVLAAPCPDVKLLSVNWLGAGFSCGRIDSPADFCAL